VDRQGKMSKSKGGFTTLFSLIDAGVHPLAYRLLCLSAHYRSELEFSVESLSAAVVRLKRLVMAATQLKERHAELVSASIPPSGSNARSILKQVQDDVDPKLAPVLTQFDTALSSDLNTPLALTALDEALAMKKVEPAQKLALVAAMDTALGLNLLTLTRADLRLRPKSATITEAEIEAELDRRQQARAAKDFAASDAIRDALAARGVEVMDGDPLRWEWKVDLG
jgi:cysteinyl-tRNA synthetase